MPSIASFSKILGLVICCQWVIFCSSRDGGVIVSAPTDDSLRAARPSYDVPRSCGEEHRLAEAGGLSRTQSAHLLTPLNLGDDVRPASLARSQSSDEATSLGSRPRIKKAGSSPGELYLLAERRRSSLAVLGIAVVGTSGDLPALHEPLSTGIPSAAHQSLALDLPDDDSRDEPDSSPPGSPTKRIALSIPRADILRPDDLLRLAVRIDDNTARNIRVLFGALATAINETKEKIETLIANIESSCREALNQGFKWGAISTRDVAVDGLEYLPLAERLVSCINTPELALRYCLKDPTTDLKTISTLLTSVKESDERTIRETLGSVFMLHKLPRHDCLKDLIERMIKYSNDPSSALEMCIKPGIHLETFKAELESAIAFGKSKQEEISEHNVNLATLSILCPTLPARAPSASSYGEA